MEAGRSTGASSSGIWRNGWQRGLGNPNPPPFAHFFFTYTRAKDCLRQMKNWITGRPRRWPDTGSPQIRIRGPERTKTSQFLSQRPRLNLDLRGHPTGGGSRRTGHQMGCLRFGQGGLRAQFHRDLAQDLSNPPRDRNLDQKEHNRRKDKNGWRNPSSA